MDSSRPTTLPLQAGDSSDSEVKISIERKRKLRRRKRRKLDRAKERDWKEKRRNRKKEKLIKVQILGVDQIFTIYTPACCNLNENDEPQENVRDSVVSVRCPICAM